MTPEAIGPYRIVGTLGEGGQGIVYLGSAPDGTRVAIKVLREGVIGDGRFAKEIAAARRVEPFCIAQVLDASLGGRPYIVTEYVEGPSLQQAGPHTGADLQRLAVATATALAAIHRAGVVHRDFKPANVLLGRDGARVIDFGIARAMDDAVTRTSSIVGTPAYMAPEQFLGAPAGPAVDVFAWGSVMVYAATGAPPFGNDSLPAVLRRIQYEEPRLDGVPEPLRSIVRTCLAKDPAARPAMQDVLFQLIGASPVRPAQPPHPAPFPAGPPFPGATGGPGAVHGSGAGGRPGAVHGPGAGGGPGTIHGSGRDGGFAHGRTGPTRTSSRNHLVLALLAGGTAVVVTAGVAAAAVWWPTWRGGPGTSAAITGAASTPASTRPTGEAKQSAKTLSPPKTPKTSKTPKVSRTPTTPKTPRHTPTPTSVPTEKTATPTVKPTTAKPTTAKPSTAGGVRSVAFTYEGIRLGDCWRYDMNIWAKVSATGTYSYRWLVNGQNQGRQSGTSASRPLLPSITWKQEGTYRVVFEVITPARSQKSVTVNICDFDKGW
ncbi:serine/threonine protein kinase [Nonomuraea fuscirosea]|uniref:serine/threonine protein kinase n=1 Tax=Nonomuraea fuscirosea TaxID=1291556 RepID=UPI003788B65A